MCIRDRCMDRESLRKIQSIRLKKIVDYVYHNTPFYRKKMEEMGISPDDINSIDDIVELPFTTKHDLRDNYPFGLCAVPMTARYAGPRLKARTYAPRASGRRTSNPSACR